ncbi:Alpha/Beta hydrolase protein [Biscogniauxia mediterranea]|nr:Alpha/Beta hydrolase protein [Biscogniauxia mediterranea]
MALLSELPDKLTLSYAIFADHETTKTVFYHHEFPSSHDEAYQPNRRILDWPADLLALADHLHVDRFVVFGVSGGCPYVLACCHQLPKSRWSTWLIATIFDLLRLEQELTASFRTRPKADRDVWDRNPELRWAVTAGLRLIAGRRSGRGMASFCFFGHDWGFDLKDLKVEPGALIMWHGIEDVNKASKIITNAELGV